MTNVTELQEAAANCQGLQDAAQDAHQFLHASTADAQAEDTLKAIKQALIAAEQATQECFVELHRLRDEMRAISDHKIVCPDTGTDLGSKAATQPATHLPQPHPTLSPWYVCNSCGHRAQYRERPEACEVCRHDKIVTFITEKHAIDWQEALRPKDMDLAEGQGRR